MIFVVLDYSKTIMRKILNIKESLSISRKIKRDGKSIVLVGGCFDILHIGHVKFLGQAKKAGDFLFLLLESDESVKNLKGEDRPINNQKDRAEILSSLSHVDYIVILTKILKDKDYDDLVTGIKPNFIAITNGDRNHIHKKRQAEKISAKIIALKRFRNKSTTRILSLI